MDVSEFVVAVLPLELTPGPSMAYLATLSLVRGRVPGFKPGSGVATFRAALDLSWTLRARPGRANVAHRRGMIRKPDTLEWRHGPGGAA